MATPAGELKVFITASLEGLRKGLEDARGMMEKMGPVLKRAALVASGAIVAGLMYSVHAYAEAERAATGLAVALKNQGVTSRIVLKEMLDYAGSLQQVTGISNGAITEAQTLLVTMGLTGETLRQATRASVDLSTRTGDLRSAAQLLGNAARGETDRLKRYGIVIAEGTPKALRFAEALRQVNAMYGGRAAADATTLSGKLNILKNTLSDAGEIIGEILMKSIKELIDYLNNNREGLLGFAEKLGNRVFDLLDILRRIVNFVNQHWTALKIAAFVGGVAGIALGGPAAALGGLGVAAVAGRSLINQSFGKSSGTGPVPFIPPFPRGKRGDLLDTAATAASAGEPKGGPPIPDPTAAQQFKAAWQDALEQVGASAINMTNLMVGAINGVISTVSQSFQDVFIGLAEGGKHMGEILGNIGKSFRNLMFKVISDILTQWMASKLLQMAITRRAHIEDVQGAAVAAAANNVAAMAKIPWGWILGIAAAGAIIAAVSGLAKFKEGGFVRGEGGEDSVLARLTPGELVLNKRQQRALFAGAGIGGLTININGTFIEGDETHWDRLVRRVIIPRLDDYSLKTRSDRPFKMT